MQPQISGEQPKQLYLAGVLEIARRRWWVLLAGALAGTLLVVVAGAAARPGYEGSIKLLVGPIGGSYSELKAASQQAETYADLAVSEPVLQTARARLHDRSATVSANADYFTRLLTISAVARRRAAADEMASAVADSLKGAIRSRRPGPLGQLTVLGPVETSPAASGGRRKTLVAIAALAGLLATLTVLVSVDRRRPVLAAGAA